MWKVMKGVLDVYSATLNAFLPFRLERLFSCWFSHYVLWEWAKETKQQNHSLC